jgi:long-chain-fatty-acyl-CoA reductase
VHVLPGNVPSSTVMSTIRALLTKNVSVLKAASGDPVTPAALALSFAEVDPTHPVSRAVNVVYWPENDPLGREVAYAADGVCAWGAGAAIEWARANTAPEASFVPFGPKRSVALIGKDADLRAAALGVAHDVSVNDQAACFSMQRVFVEGSPDPLVGELESALKHYEDLLPPQQLSVDDLAALNAARLDYVFNGGKDYGAGTRAAIIVAPPDLPIESPLRRTVLVHPVADLREAYSYVDSGVQTVGAAPWSLLEAHREELARRGVNRFVELGLSNVFRVGGAHDGMRPLQRLVRYASHESASTEIPKGMVLALDQTRILENRSFTDVVF